MQPRSIPCLFIALLGLFVDAKTSVPLDAAEGQDRLRAPLPLREPPLAFGVEFEYVFPEAFATVSEKERYHAVADALDNVLETRPIVYDDYFSAHSNEHPTTWKVVPDASLVGPAGGFEVVSPILTDVAEMKAVLDSMQDFGAELSETTDFHVHVDVTGRSMYELRRVYKHFIAYERAMDSFQPPNHRINQNPYLQSIRELFTTVSEAWRTLDACTTLECLMTTVQPGRDTDQEEARRSYKLNLAEHSSGTTTSLEFRGHHGTLDSETAQHWIRLVTTMVKTSVDNTCASVPPRDGTLQEMLDTFLREGDSAKSHTAREAFYENRIQMLNAESEKPGSLYARKVQSLDEIFGAARELGGGKRGYGKHYRGRKGGGGGGGGRRSGSSRGGRSDRRRSSSSRGGSSGR